MCAVLLASNFYSALATAVLFLHGLFILWVIFGALLVRTLHPSLVAYRFSCLGNPYGTASVAVPFDCVGELPGSQGGRGAIPGWISASLS
jgi:hypothetical protein